MTHTPVMRPQNKRRSDSSMEGTMGGNEDDPKVGMCGSSSKWELKEKGKDHVSSL